MVPPFSDRIARVPPYSRTAALSTRTGLSPAMARLSRRFRFLSYGHWPGPRSLATTSGVSVDVLSSGYLDVSVGRVRFVFLCIQKTMTLTGRVSPFGNPRIDGCSPLPTAYRSVLRPSSPLSAKAFTRCPYALDLCLEFFTHRDKRPCRSSSKPSSYTQRFFKTANQFGTPTPRARFAIACETNITAFGRRPERPGSQSKRIPIDNDKQRARNDNIDSIGHKEVLASAFEAAIAAPHEAACDRKAGGADRDRTGDPLLAKQVLSQLSYSPGKRWRSAIRSERSVCSARSREWWAKEDLNFRPHAYQARALTN